MKPQKIPTFLSYAHIDEVYKDNFMQHLTGLMETKLELWQDRLLIAGQDWDETIKKQLTQSQLILFLVSPAFRSSTYIKEVEMALTFQQKKAKGAVEIIPIMLRPTDIGNSILEKIQFLPKNAKPVTTWDNEDTAWLDVVNGIKKVLPNLEKYNLPDPKENVTPKSEIIEQVLDKLAATDPLFKAWQQQHQLVNRHIRALATVEEKCYEWLMEHQVEMKEYTLANLDKLTLELEGLSAKDFYRFANANFVYLGIVFQFKRSLNFGELLEFLAKKEIEVVEEYSDIYQAIFQQSITFISHSEKDTTFETVYATFLKQVLERLGACYGNL